MDFQLMRSRIIELVQKYHYPEIINYLQPSIRMKTVPRQEDSIGIGASKIGGLPDLPEGLEWPEWKGTSLPFIAQIHLPDITNYDVNMLLPYRGILYFFFDIDLYFSSRASSSLAILFLYGYFTHSAPNIGSSSRTCATRRNCHVFVCGRIFSGNNHSPI